MFQRFVSKREEKMFVHQIAVCFVLVLNVALSVAYVVPKARVEVLRPKGFSVSIPDTPGIQMFSFHGNLNSPMEGLENGQFSSDILKHKNGRWTFTNRKHEIKPGDVLYYWLYVQKDSLGYRRDDQKHEFTESDVYGGINSTEETSTEFNSNDYTERPVRPPTIPHLPTGSSFGSNAGSGYGPNTGSNSFGSGSGSGFGSGSGLGGTGSGTPNTNFGNSFNENCNARTPPVRVFPQEVHHYHHHYLPTLAPNGGCQQSYGAGNGASGQFPNGGGYGQNGNSFNNGGSQDTQGSFASIQQLTHQMSQVMIALEYMKLKVATLSEVVDELINSNTNTKLLLTGVSNVDQTTNLFDLVRHIILDRLELKDLKNDIYSATRTKKGIVFDVASGLDKRRILARARERFRGDEEELRITDYYDGSSDGKTDGSSESALDTRFGNDDDDE